VNVCLADCLSSNKDAFEITTELAASLAVDNNVNTHSCTESTEAFPWWVVDLGQAFSVGSITITFPNVNGLNRNYRRLASFVNYVDTKGVNRTRDTLQPVKVFSKFILLKVSRASLRNQSM